MQIAAVPIRPIKHGRNGKVWVLIKLLFFIDFLLHSSYFFVGCSTVGSTPKNAQQSLTIPVSVCWCYFPYTAQMRLKDKGAIVPTEAQAFTKKALAQAWIKR